MKKFLYPLPLILLLLFLLSIHIPIPAKRLNPAPVISLRIVDRENILLREVLSDEGGRCLWIDLATVSPDLLKATITAEDRRFFRHTGVNFLAVIRAFFQNIKTGHIVSGASTISQQLIRNIYHFRRNVWAKAHETWLALRLERTLSKEDILIQYLNRISYGNQAFGIEAASRLYFDKSSSQLSLAESAFLAGLPRSPSVLNPYHTPDLAIQRQKSILNQMYRLKFLDQETFRRALDEPLRVSPVKEKFKAPHFCDYILSRYTFAEKQRLSTVKTTLDYSLQKKIETLVENHIDSLENKGITNGAAVILDNHTGEILSMVGSKDFFDISHDGQVNAVLSLRQPGSTLKPFTYGLALEQGMTAAAIIFDSPVQYSTPEGTYTPRNYDLKFHGPVRLREALACSFNVPAVTVLEAIGPERLYLLLKDMGFDSLDKGPGHYGIGLTLGNGEVTLLELVQAYSALARNGLWLEHRSILAEFDSDEKPVFSYQESRRSSVFSPQVAYILTHILSDRDARIPAFGYNSTLALPFPCAVKTGTSKDYRDNWTVGYTPDYTVGVWVGNFNGRSMNNVSGVTGCGPLFRDIMLALEGQNLVLNFARQEGLIEVEICPLSGQLKGEHCPGGMKEIFISGTAPQTECAYHHPSQETGATGIRAGIQQPPAPELVITFPQEGDTFKVDPFLRRGYQTIELRISLPPFTRIEQLEWWINGRREAVTSSPYIYSWKLQPGFYTITACARCGDGAMTSRSVHIKVLP